MIQILYVFCRTLEVKQCIFYHQNQNKWVPEGFILSQMHLSFYIDNLCTSLSYSTYHLYVDDTIIYGNRLY